MESYGLLKYVNRSTLIPDRLYNRNMEFSMSEFRRRIPELLAKAWAGERLVVVHRPGNGKARRFVICREEEMAKMAKTLVFKPGDRVTWSSQAWGTKSEKRGTIVGFVPKLKSLVDVWNNAFPGQPFVKGKCDLLRSSVDRYLVLVDRGINPRTGKQLKPTAYAPRATVVQELKDDTK